MMKLYGWVGKILKIDLSSRKIEFHDTAPYLQHYLGGRSLAVRLAWENIPPGADAYDENNCIIIATGPLTGTLAPTSGRTVVTSVSPRVYPKTWYTHSTFGGWFGPALKYAGYDALIIRGKANVPVFIQIIDDQVKILEAGSLWGMDTFQTQIELRKSNANTQVLTIGPAGENKVRFATVHHAEDCASGHSGFGAVWGDKNLKAIAVRGSGGVTVAHPEELLQEILRKGTGKSSIVSTPLWQAGKNRKRPVCSQACGFNCIASVYTDVADERKLPAQCIGAINWFSDDSLLRTEYRGGGIYIPPSKNFGKFHESSLLFRCNSLGLDLWFRLVMQPWLHRCVLMGINEIRGHQIAPDDLNWFNDFMHDLAYRQNLGELFAESMRRAMDELEGELPEELINLGREMEFAFGFPAHREGRFWDEEALPFWVISAMMYASESRDPTIGTHNSSLMLSDFLMADRDAATRQFRKISEKVWGYPQALDPTTEKKAPVASWAQKIHILIDSLPLCDFAFPELIKRMDAEEDWKNAEDILGDLDFDLRILRAVTGLDLTREEMMTFAERTCNLERAMLARWGRTRQMEDALWPHFQLPCKQDGTFADQIQFTRLLDEFFQEKGWDLQLGWPQREALTNLGLDDVAAELENLRSHFRDTPDTTT